MLRVGLISDTHGLLRPEAVAFMRGCHHIVHGGDVGNQSVLQELSALAPVSAVRGNAVFNEIFHPISRRILAKCDACLRIGGPSAGADEMVSLAKQHGKVVYHSLQEVPGVSSEMAAKGVH